MRIYISNNENENKILEERIDEMNYINLLKDNVERMFAVGGMVQTIIERFGKVMIQFVDCVGAWIRQGDCSAWLLANHVIRTSGNSDISSGSGCPEVAFNYTIISSDIYLFGSWYCIKVVASDSNAARCATIVIDIDMIQVILEVATLD